MFEERFLTFIVYVVVLLAGFFLNSCYNGLQEHVASRSQVKCYRCTHIPSVVIFSQFYKL